MALKFLWQMIKGEKSVIWYTLCYFISACVSLCLPILLGNIVDVATLENATVSAFLISCGVYAGVGFGVRIIDYIGYFFGRSMYPAVSIKATKFLYDKVSEKSVSFIMSHGSGNLSSKINNVYDGMSTFMSCIIHGLVINGVLLIGSFSIMGYLLPNLFLAVLGFSIVFVILIYKFSHELKEKQMKYNSDKDIVSGKIVDAITNILLVKSFNGEAKEDKHLNGAFANLRTSDEDTVAFWAKLNLSQFSLYTIFLTLSVTYCGYLLLDDQIVISTFVIANSLVVNCAYNLNRQVSELKIYFKTAGTIENTLKTVLQETDIKDKPNAKKLKLKKASIEFKDVDFKYSDG
ncbi:MAG: ABC transporter ATP-binding protein, partial [Proteobacteria bacterium]|nr:ABC transporter ATP-binding protein [Pseudomonadota bacterium]